MGVRSRVSRVAVAPVTHETPPSRLSTRDLSIGETPAGASIVKSLFFRHEWILVIAWRRERLFDRSRANPSHEIELRARLVVRPRAARAAERLLANHRARRL